MAKLNCPRQKGLTLLEILLVMGIFVTLIGLGSPYLFGAKEKALLTTQRDLILADLKTGQQKAMAAYKGQGYLIRFDPDNETYTLQPDILDQTKSLMATTGILTAQPTELEFTKLTGQPTEALSLVLESKRFKTEITLSLEGIFNITPPEKK